MNENERKVVVRRMLLLIAVACIIMGLYTFRLIFLQLVNGDDFKAKATTTTDYKFTVTAARGNIVDSTGKRIATTTTSYNVVLNKLQMGDEDLDSLLQRLVELLCAGAVCVRRFADHTRAVPSGGGKAAAGAAAVFGGGGI